MASEHTVTKVLLEWINSFSLGKTLRATDELTDGIMLWEILQDIDPQYFLEEIPERNSSDHWVAKWQNLKHIHKLLLNYIRHQNDDILPSGLDPSPDLEAIAEKASAKETNKLLKLLLIAAISSPNAGTYVQTLQELSTSTQEGLKDIIEEAHNGQYEPMDAADELREDLAKHDRPVDIELQFEERVGKVLAENDRLTHEKKELEKALEDLHNRLARLQENNDTLQNRLASTEDRLVTLKSGKGDIGFNAKALESKTRQQDDLIASQEAKLTAAQDEIDSLRMTVESLRVKNQRYQKLQDDYDELRTEKDQLARKANAAEKYRQKLQASQDFEKENQTLKNQIKDLQQQLKESDSQQRWSSEREVELEEYRKLLPQVEQECNEIQNLKKQLEFNNHALTERLESADEQHERDDALISELRERLGEMDGLPGSQSPGSETPKMQGTLHKDFEALGVKESLLYACIFYLKFHRMLIIHSKSENDDLKPEIESMKGPSAVCIPSDFLLVYLILIIASRALILEASLKTLLHLCSWHALLPHKGLISPSIVKGVALTCTIVRTIGNFTKIIPVPFKELQRSKTHWKQPKGTCLIHRLNVSQLQFHPICPKEHDLQILKLVWSIWNRSTCCEDLMTTILAN